MKIYTKTGDRGETGLVGGTRVSKADIRLETYGDVDELNSHLGFLVSQLDKGKFKDDLKVIVEVQNSLFTLGSNLASEVESREKFKLPKIQTSVITLLENKIDEYEKNLKPLKNFILPNGAPASAASQIARSVCRRVERKFVSFSLQMPEEAPEHAGELLNRLSDYLFVFARYINKLEGESETIWKA